MLTIDRERNTARVTNNGSRNRQQAYRAKMQSEGFVQVTGWVHKTQEADATEYLKALRANTDLTVGPLRDPATGRLVSLKHAFERGEDE